MSIAAIQKTIGLRMVPLDVLLFRDGKPFMSGNEYMVSGLPLPQTFAGAIRTALLHTAGCDLNSLDNAIQSGKSFEEAVCRSCPDEFIWISQLRVRGPWLAMESDTQFEVLVPTPSILHQKKQTDSKTLHRLSPISNGELPGWNPPSVHENLRPLWLKTLASTEPAAGLLSANGLDKFLQGNELTTDDLIPLGDLYDFDNRTGIGISPDRMVAEESQIFGRGFLSLKKNVFLYGEVVLPDDAPEHGCLDQVDLLAFGGESRHVKMQCLDQAYSWSSYKPQNERQKPFLYLTTPCAFDGGWKPQCLNGTIAAAAVPAPIPFSGWDLARGGPKPTRFAVPAGSVYFLDSLPDSLSDSLAETEEEQRQGWGCYLKGVWNDE